ncbi:MAG: hypothetical protein RL154_1182 [Pseudomonadota bacterium]|jgi:predicted  nucleic acid-binding Zn-ribbon protein
MNEQLRKVAELAHIDAEIDSFGPKEDEVRSELNKLVERNSRIEIQIEDLKVSLKELGYKKSKNDIHLKELSTKMQEFSKRSASLKNEREIKALQVEEEITKEQIDQANDEIARFEALEQSKKEKIAELTSELERLKTDIGSAEEGLKDQIASIAQNRQSVYERKDKLVYTINPKVYGFYQRIRRWAGNTTVVQAQNKACMGCYMVITDNDFRRVIVGEEIVTCPHCGRILYSV